MQKIQDKAFDQLFKDKLGKAEIQPSADLWKSITAELQPEPKRKLPVYWLAAAAALIITGIGLLLMPEQEKIRLQAPAKIVGQTGPTATKAMATTVADEPVQTYSSTPLVIVPRLKPEIKEQPDLKIVQPRQLTEHLVLKPVEEEGIQEVKQQGPVINEVALASNHPEADIIETRAEESAGKGIRNVGDVINFVVNRVDKREKKIIKFDTDDDNSSVVALNIGFIKLNRKSDK